MGGMGGGGMPGMGGMGPHGMGMGGMGPPGMGMGGMGPPGMGMGGMGAGMGMGMGPGAMPPSGLPPEYTSNPSMPRFNNHKGGPGGVMNPYPNYAGAGPPSPASHRSSSSSPPPQRPPKHHQHPRRKQQPPAHYEHVPMGAYASHRRPPRPEAKTSSVLNRGQRPHSNKTVGPSGKEWIRGDDAFLDACICTTGCTCRKSQRVLYRARRDDLSDDDDEGDGDRRGKYGSGEIRYILKEDLGRDCGDHSGCRKGGSDGDDGGKGKQKREQKREKKEEEKRRKEELDDFRDELLDAIDERIMRGGGLHDEDGEDGTSPARRRRRRPPPPPPPPLGFGNKFGGLGGAGPGMGPGMPFMMGAEPNRNPRLAQQQMGMPRGMMGGGGGGGGSPYAAGMGMGMPDKRRRGMGGGGMPFEDDMDMSVEDMMGMGIQNGNNPYASMMNKNNALRPDFLSGGKPSGAGPKFGPGATLDMDMYYSKPRGNNRAPGGRRPGRSYMDSESDDFDFRRGTNRANPSSPPSPRGRHKTNNNNNNNMIGGGPAAAGRSDQRGEKQARVDTDDDDAY
ncbi:hypothetical protein BDW02DRAFT_634567 [Decorospora gaudefroyi]|uniref:Uncharacterized protein n=1 Tax=Decorospora gaudefroyi TaxID=184978 RepID=A0A6A5JZR8_9PLEO|nr:hypothetical protein BDW02DRAFT_634567 [Decorospora gaudefroyi]